MEATSSRGRSRGGSTALKRRIGSGFGAGSGSTGQSLNDDTLRSVFSRLDDHFDLARCSAVCSSWNRVIETAHLMRDLYYKRNPPASGSSSNVSVKSYFETLAMHEHSSSLSSGPAEVYQWIGHPKRATLCRIKSGSILTGVGDEFLRLWSAETCKFMNEYNVPKAKTLVDFDFDENKIVGLTSSQICIWRRNEPRSIFQSGGASFNHGLCMSYADPEVVIGCEDGRAFVYDMYSRSCSSIYRLHSSPVTCLTITDDQLIIGGSTFGNVAIADQTSGQKIGVLKSAYAPLVIRSLSVNTNSHMIFAGSSGGYAHCWDLRTLRPLWEPRVSPNVIYSAHHLPGDTAMLAVGGIDGVLRLICQRTGDIIRSIVVDTDRPAESTSRSRQQIEKKHVREVASDARVDNISRRLRPQITSLSVGMKKIVTTHGENYIRILKFRPKKS
ncbi:F-box/WD-40 repeat-containing protein [Dichanthelium oligosanthes]|uniref:F-box/WD-40 repeat-containing protein n=1 Tax=Dichanthelium oligosanthes TaxID=888268 RepID=A0A1E5UXD9_9POAL|nr:F-box/WD-40 repeat-containing protein [Dichanthelium oligosanthes]